MPLPLQRLSTLTERGAIIQEENNFQQMSCRDFVYHLMGAIFGAVRSEYFESAVPRRAKSERGYRKYGFSEAENDFFLPQG